MQDVTGRHDDRDKALGEVAAKRVKHLREILIWPVYLLPLDEDAPIQNHWEHLATPGGRFEAWMAWHEVRRSTP